MKRFWQVASLVLLCSLLGWAIWELSTETERAKEQQKAEFEAFQKHGYEETGDKLEEMFHESETEVGEFLGPAPRKRSHWKLEREDVFGYTAVYRGIRFRCDSEGYVLSKEYISEEVHH